MNEVFVLIAKEKFKMDGETVVLTAVTPNNIEFVYEVVDKHDSFKQDYDVMLQYYCAGEPKSIEKYDFEAKEFVAWLDLNSATECE